MYSGGSNPRNTNRWTQLQFNDKKKIRQEKNLMGIMPHLRSVDRGAFFLLRECVTSYSLPFMRVNYMVKFYS